MTFNQLLMVTDKVLKLDYINVISVDHGVQINETYLSYLTIVNWFSACKTYQFTACVVSQGSVAMHCGYGEKYNNSFVMNCLQDVPPKKFGISIEN